MTDPRIPTLFEWVGGMPALEWGSRAVISSRSGTVATEDAPMPRWGWGVPGGPYLA